MLRSPAPSEIPATKGWCFGLKIGDSRLHCSGQRSRKAMCNYRMWAGNDGEETCGQTSAGTESRAERAAVDRTIDKGKKWIDILKRKLRGEE